MTIEVKKTVDLRVGENYQLKALAYGKTGTWKTGAIRTLPRSSTKSIFVIDTDKGELTNRGIDGIDYVEIDPDQLIKGSNPKGWEMANEAKRYFLDHKENYSALVVDSLTTLADAALANIMFINRHQITGNKDDQGASLPDLNMEKQLVTNFLMEVLSTGRHLYCICHEEIIKSELTGIIMRLPAARGQLQGKINIWFDEVMHSRMKDVIVTENKVTKHVLKPYWLTKSGDIYVCKSRLGNREDIEDEQPADFVKYAKLCGVDLK
jgi:hypothetical protein